MWNSLILGGLEGVWGPGTISTVWSVMTITTPATLKHSAFLDFFFFNGSKHSNCQELSGAVGEVYVLLFQVKSCKKVLRGGK